MPEQLLPARERLVMEVMTTLVGDERNASLFRKTDEFAIDILFRPAIPDHGISRRRKFPCENIAKAVALCALDRTSDPRRFRHAAKQA